MMGNVPAALRLKEERETSLEITFFNAQNDKPSNQSETLWEGEE